MFQELEKRIAKAVEDHLAVRYGVDMRVSVEQPKQAAFGEMALPAAFQLAKQQKQAPRKIAEELVADIGVIDGVAALEVAGNGYINVRLDRAAYVQGLLTPPLTASTDTKPKIIVEHTNINPNKAAHIGHLRNAVLGDTLVRMLRSEQRHVEVQNYIDNTGVQVADVVVGFHHIEKKSLAQVRELIADTSRPFDYVCWDLYARTSSRYKDEPETLAWRSETLHAIESGQGEVAELAHVIADAIVKAHLATMYRLGIEYDVLPRESEILHLHFWATAFEQLKERKAIHLETEGKNKGCWVMPASAFKQAGGAVEPEDDSKVIVRSNGTVTYVGKDIAYQLWKLGLLGKDFYYRPWSTYPDGHEVWVSTDQPSESKAPAFGRGSEVFNVIDSRQSYLQDVVVAGLRALGYNDQADRSIHFAYEMVALSPRTCVEMGIELSDEDKRKPYVEVSGRKGLGVKADDLIDKLIETALAEVDHRHADAPPEERKQVATQIAIGALRYFMLKFTRNSVIAFDFQEALSFEGETGPYVQYALVRANNILRKYEARGEKLPNFRDALTKEQLNAQLALEDSWQMVLIASKVGSAVNRAIASGEPSHVARYAFQIAQAFNNFYHLYSVINEEDQARRTFLLWLTTYFQSQLTAILTILGIEQPAYM